MPRLTDLDWSFSGGPVAPSPQQQAFAWNTMAARQQPLYDQARIGLDTALRQMEPTQADNLVRDYQVGRPSGYSYINGQVYLNGQQQPGNYTEEQGRNLLNTRRNIEAGDYERRLTGENYAGLNRQLLRDSRFQRLDDQTRSDVYRSIQGREIMDDAQDSVAMRRLGMQGPGFPPTVNDMRTLSSGLARAGYETPMAAIQNSDYQQMAQQYGLPTARPLPLADQLNIAKFQADQIDEPSKLFKSRWNMSPGEFLSLYDPTRKKLVIPGKNLGDMPTEVDIPEGTINEARRIALGEQAYMASQQRGPQQDAQAALERIKYLQSKASMREIPMYGDEMGEGVTQSELMRMNGY